MLNVETQSGEQGPPYSSLGGKQAHTHRDRPSHATWRVIDWHRICSELCGQGSGTTGFSTGMANC